MRPAANPAELLPADPFGPAADPERYVPRAATDRVLAEIVRRVTADEPVVLSGPEGIGKSLVLRLLCRHLPPGIDAVYLPYPALPAPALCAWALSTLGEGTSYDPVGALLEHARALGEAGESLVLLVDNAEALSAAAAEELARAAGRSNGTLRLVAASDHAAAEVIRSAWPKARLIALEEALTLEETAGYLAAYLRDTPADPAAPAGFDEGLVARIHEESGGVPGRINAVASRMLLAARLAGSEGTKSGGASSPASGPDAAPPLAEPTQRPADAARQDESSGSSADAARRDESPAAPAREDETSPPITAPPLPPPPAWAQEEDSNEPPVAAAPLPPLPAWARAPKPRPLDSAPPLPPLPDWARETEPVDETQPVEQTQPGSAPIMAPPLPPPPAWAEEPEAHDEPMPGLVTDELLPELEEPSPELVTDELLPELEEPSPEAAVEPPRAPEADHELALERAAGRLALAHATGGHDARSEELEPGLERAIGRLAISHAEREAAQRTAADETDPPMATPSAADEAPSLRTAANDLAPAGEEALAPGRSGASAWLRAGVIGASLAVGVAVGSTWVRSLPPPLEPVGTEPPAALSSDAEPRIETRPAAARREAPAPEPAPVAASAEPSEGALPTAPPVSVQINATPWATIYVDGEQVGVTPLAGVELTPGGHRFEAHFPDGRISTREVQIDSTHRFVVFP